MANVLDIRRRIRSVKNTRQITKAMKMVSAARLRRAQDRALSARPYALMITNILHSLVSRSDLFDPHTGEPRHPLLGQRPEQTILLVVVTGDRGLAGAFNSNVLKAASKFLEFFKGKNINIAAVGRKGRDYLRRRYPVRNPESTARAGEVEIVGEHLNLLAKLDYEEVAEIVQRVIDAYKREEIDSVYVIYNEFKSVIAQKTVVEQLLPIPRGDFAGETKVEAESAATDYLYEPDPATIFAKLLPRYVESRIFHALLESNAAFYAAQMTAMEAAVKNSTEMIDSLTLYMNKVRQAAITREIIEVVSGAQAL